MEGLPAFPFVNSFSMAFEGNLRFFWRGSFQGIPWMSNHSFDYEHDWSHQRFHFGSRYGCGSKPCTPGEHQTNGGAWVNSPPQHGGIGYDPWPHLHAESFQHSGTSCELIPSFVLKGTRLCLRSRDNTQNPERHTSVFVFSPFFSRWTHADTSQNEQVASEGVLISRSMWEPHACLEGP